MTEAWDVLRQDVRATARVRGMTLSEVAVLCGYAPSTLTTQLSLRSPPSPAMQAALRSWLGGDPASQTPQAAPPSWDPHPASLMCLPLPNFSHSQKTVSPVLTPESESESESEPESGSSVVGPHPDWVRWEHHVLRLPDHDWAGQVDALDVLGRFGWALVCVSGGVAYMRRRV